MRAKRKNLIKLIVMLLVVAVLGTLSLTGLLFGIHCGGGIARKIRAELLGGIILVIIGCKILIEHLFFS